MFYQWWNKMHGELQLISCLVRRSQLKWHWVKFPDLCASFRSNKPWKMYLIWKWDLNKCKKDLWPNEWNGESFWKEPDNMKALKTQWEEKEELKSSSGKLDASRLTPLGSLALKPNGNPDASKGGKLLLQLSGLSGFMWKSFWSA